ncbi:OmpP1/FadL family transporter [Solitalea koreensis]|uniref:Long-chain fatty acid transport protein n=1 Tax=Solitalea koreensis TaxID=543615 RepID=A0A521CQ70_9SPHI|nr:hypothetical protein [Solitalea koreensis]SMO60810.1 Long-chain fatty acid transport protein [Solitalea koreensis]
MYKFTRVVTSVLLSLISAGAFAQATTNSPYSAYGIGGIVAPTFVPSKGMGGLSFSMRNPDNINFANPASYNALYLTTIEAGAHGVYNKLTTSSLSENNKNFSIDHLAFGFPVGKENSSKWGMAFGMLPFSTSGYQVGTKSNLDTVQVSNNLDGDGGYSQVFIGNSVKVVKDLSVGFNISYVFGEISRTNNSEFTIPGAFNSRTTSATSVSGFNFNYGLQYVLKKGDHNLILSYSGSPKLRLDAKTDYVSDRYVKNSQGTIIRMDTSDYHPGVKGSYLLPSQHGFGIMYQKPFKLQVGLDFQYQNWSNFEQNDQNQGFKDAYSVILGTQYTPDITSVSKYSNRIDYRAGFSYNKSYLYLNSKNINQVQLSFGVGLPLSHQSFGGNLYTASKLNIAVELGQRGTTENDLVKEQYARLNFGLTLNDRWFVKRKFD